jgi:hypothetical protein
MLRQYDPNLLLVLGRSEEQADGLPGTAPDPTAPRFRRARGSEREAAWALVQATREQPAWNAARQVAYREGRLLANRSLNGTDDSDEWMSRLRTERRAQAGLLRDIFGHLFHEGPLYLADVVAHEGVLPLARSIYAERSFSEMPILADALEEAGCTDEVLLEHCREPGEHVRGCWVMDAILGRS